MDKTTQASSRFAAFILTHGRPDNVLTYSTLKRQGYTGPIYLVVDNEDDTIDEYVRRYGDSVVVFDKQAIASTMDAGDNFKDRRAVIYARNACFQIATNFGLEYFLQLDDDYYEFQYKINTRHEYPSGQQTIRTGLDAVIEAYLDYYRAIPAASIAMAQGGDFFGGEEQFGIAKRKAMNSFFCSVDRPFQFVGRINEDVNTYTSHQMRGNLFITVPFVMLNQRDTQSTPGGMTELYLDSGTYIKSFYSVMYCPSCVTVEMMGRKHRRLHHRISWDRAVPCIVREAHRKASARKAMASQQVEYALAQ